MIKGNEKHGKVLSAIGTWIKNRTMPYIGAPEGMKDDDGGPLFDSDESRSDDDREKDLDKLVDELEVDLPESVESEN